MAPKMTSRASAASCPEPTRRTTASAGGFTLVEMLLTLAVLMVVITLSVAAINKARRSASTNRVRADFQSLTMALEQYKADFKSYPMRASFTDGPVLARWLVGPGDANDDGVDGPGFKAARDPVTKVWFGKTRQPYYPSDRVRFLPPNDPAKGNWRIVDAFGYIGEPMFNAGDPYRFSGYVQYYPQRNLKPGSVGKVPGISGGTNSGDLNARYDESDGDIPVATLRFVLGDLNVDATIGAGESLTFNGPFILASPGPDGIFTDLKDATTVDARRKLINSSDDIYNIAQ